MRVKTIVQCVRLGGKRYRVIRPATPLSNAALHDHERDAYSMYVDRMDGRRVGALWLLAARSPRSLVYLPMRAAPVPPGIGDDLFPERPLDLVLAHHSLQFPPSRWKQIRERITAGNAPRELRTAGVPDSDLPADDEVDYATLNRQDNRDVLHQRLHAETLFLTGSTAAFREPARHFFAVAEEGPPAAARALGKYLYIQGACNYHVCRLFYWPYLDSRGNREIHVEYCPRWTR
ncbi:hypothetical protein [Actinoallomurus iriomotensis]|uniref:Uncharacterized protein n=1 Tax=Actinoallomurus iriomotensis TaxID=478107 RepID=A0A9W6RX21_9ACTN|nr:hypothetical protein [Actinoallomurus iriomotensis]GLY83099.1 hypothetical protein Airi02_010290 [Actinoallomurus iriomotensis]